MHNSLWGERQYGQCSVRQDALFLGALCAFCQNSDYMIVSAEPGCVATRTTGKHCRQSVKSPTERKAGVKTEKHSQEVRAAQQQAQTWQMEIGTGQ